MIKNFEKFTFICISFELKRSNLKVKNLKEKLIISKDPVRIQS